MSLCFALLALAAPSSAGAQQRTLELLTDPTAGPDANEQVFFGAVSGDGARLLVSTAERMSPADVDDAIDVYERTGAGVTLLSGGDGAVEAGFDAASRDGRHVFFSTDERLAASDTDSADDVYERFAGALVHVTDNPIGPDAEIDALFEHVSPDGRRLYIETREPLAASDADAVQDVYELGPGGVRHISDGAGAFPATFVHASDDGGTVLFDTAEPLSAADTDGARDVYRHVPGAAPVLVSDGAVGPDSADMAFFAGASADGARIWFETRERWSATDTDANTDVYERTPSGETVHISRDPTGVESGFDAGFAGASSDGSRVFFETAESMAATDLDTALDVYERTAAGAVVHVGDDPTGPDENRTVTLGHVSSSGEVVVVETSESWTAADSDTVGDLYRRTPGGAFELVSDGAGLTDPDLPASFLGASSDGARVVFRTRERLTATDTDAADDLYERTATGAAGHLTDDPTGDDEEITPSFFAASADGARVYFGTEERLVAGDTDTAEDIYVSTTTPSPPGPGERPPPTGGPAGGDRPGGDVPRRDSRAPALRGLRFDPARGRLRFRLSERARVRFTLRRGRRVVARFTVAGRRGPNRVRPRPLRRLRPGRHRLIAIARDAAGNRSRRREWKFDVHAIDRRRA